MVFQQGRGTKSIQLMSRCFSFLSFSETFYGKKPVDWMQQASLQKCKSDFKRTFEYVLFEV